MELLLGAVLAISACDKKTFCSLCSCSLPPSRRPGCLPSPFRNELYRVYPSFLPSFLPSSVLSRPPPPPSSSTSCSGPVPKKGMSQKHEMLMSDGASRAASVQSPRVSESPGLWQMLKVQNSNSFGPKSPRKTRIFRSLYDSFYFSSN